MRHAVPTASRRGDRALPPVCEFLVLCCCLDQNIVPPLTRPRSRKRCRSLRLLSSKFAGRVPYPESDNRNLCDLWRLDLLHSVRNKTIAALLEFFLLLRTAIYIR